jgi:hypothetical protein
MIAHEVPASIGQRMLWLISRGQEDHGQLNYPLLIRLRGPLRSGGLTGALDQLVVRHEALRTTLVRREGLLTQVIHEPAPVPVTDVVLHPEADVDGTLQRCVRQESLTPLDPATAPVRVTRWVLDPQHVVVCLNAHHLVTDAWSSRILTEDLRQLLTDSTGLARVGWHYRHFVQWQRRRSTAERLQADRAYWHRQLADLPPPALAPNRGRAAGDGRGTAAEPGGGTASGGGRRTVRVDIDAGTTDRLRAVAGGERSTLFTMLLAAYHAVVARETGRSDLAVATPFANRTRVEVQRTVGFFVNMLILRTQVHPDLSLAGLLSRVGRTVGEASAHQGLAYYALSIPDISAAVGGAGWATFQMLPELPPPAACGDLQLEVLIPETAGRFPLEVAVSPHHGGLRVLCQYAPDLVDGETGNRVLTGYGPMLRAMATRPPDRQGLLDASTDPA